jgi:hypothetical protein
MAGSQTFKLIDGSFTQAEAREILLSLISAKLKFHTLKKFSDLERFGQDTMQSEKRIKELNDLDKEIRSFLDTAETADCIISITSNIDILITPKNK